MCAQLEAVAQAAGLGAGGKKTAGAEEEAAASIASRGEVTATCAAADTHPVHSAGGGEEVEVEVECVEEWLVGADAARPAVARQEEVEEESASPGARVHVSSQRTSAAAGGAGGLRKAAAVGAAAKAAAARGVTSPDRRCFGADVTNSKRAGSRSPSPVFRSPSPVSQRGGGVGAAWTHDPSSVFPIISSASGGY